MGKKSRAQRPVAATSRASGELDGLLGLIQQLMKDRQFGEALRAGRTLVEKYPLEANAHATFGAVLTDLGNPAEGLRQFDAAQRLGMAGDLALTRNMVVAAMAAKMPLHAARAARAGLRTQVTEGQIPEEVVSVFGTVLASTDLYIDSLVGGTEYDPGVAEEVLLLMEQSSQALTLGDPDRARELAEDAVRLLPSWSHPLTHLATILFTLNQVDAALETCRTIMDEREPGNARMLSTRVRLLAVTGRQEEAQEALVPLLASTADVTVVAEEQAKALAICGRDQQVYDLLSPLLAADNLHAVGKYLLGVAAANLGLADEARAAWRNLSSQGLTQAKHYSDVLLRKEKPPTANGKFTYFAAAELVPSVLLDELATQAHAARDNGRLLEVAAAYPFLPEALCETFYAPSMDARLAVDLLLPLREQRPGVVDAIRTFATGRLGTDYQRVYAHIALRASGDDDSALAATVWIGGRKRELELPALRLILPEQRQYDPRVRDLLDRGAAAQERADSAGAAQVYREVLAIDPTLAEAEHNLGTALLVMDDYAGGGDHLRRALELDPEHVLARCNLATMSLMGGDLESARTLIAPLDARLTFTFDEAIGWLRTRADLARAEGATAKAEALLQSILAYDPDNRLALERLAVLSRLPAVGAV